MPSTLNYSKWDSLDCDDDEDDRRGLPRVTRLEPGSQITIGSGPPAATAATAAAAARHASPAHGGSLSASYSKWDSMQVDDSDEEDEEDEEDDDLTIAGKEAITRHVQGKAAGGSSAPTGKAAGGPSTPAEPADDDDSTDDEDVGVGHGGNEAEIKRLRLAAAAGEAAAKLEKLTRNGAHRDGYLWRQTETEVLLSVLLPPGTRGPALRVEVRKPLTAAMDERARVVVAVRGAAAPALDAELAYPVELPDEDDDLDWEVTDYEEPNGLRLLQLTLRKQVPHGVVLWWTRALKGEEPLDASAFQDRRQRLKPGQPDPWKEATEAFKARIAEHGMPPPPP